MVLPVDAAIPDPDAQSDPVRREGYRPGARIHGAACRPADHEMRLDRVFIGSCTNSRIEDLRAAAAVVQGLRKVAASVKQALVVPGSGPVKRAGRGRGADRIFKAAGFEWREPGCSMCLAMNADKLLPANTVPRPRTAISRGVRGTVGAPIWSARRWRRRRRWPGHFVDVRTGYR
jgi:3-isopropylmalate/(R)-2-methylmalate dehydratase large subunit